MFISHVKKTNHEEQRMFVGFMLEIKNTLNIHSFLEMKLDVTCYLKQIKMYKQILYTLIMSLKNKNKLQHSKYIM